MANEELTQYPYIEFEDGSTIPGSFGEDGDTVWMWLNTQVRDNQGFVDLANRLINSAATVIMTCHISERSSYSCRGYTHLTDIIVDPITMKPNIRMRNR